MISIRTVTFCCCPLQYAHIFLVFNRTGIHNIIGGNLRTNIVVVVKPDFKNSKFITLKGSCVVDMFCYANL